MTPEILVWALLFVVGFALSYRLAESLLKRKPDFDSGSSVTPVTDPEPAAPALSQTSIAVDKTPAFAPPSTRIAPPPPVTAKPPAPQPAAAAASVRATIAPTKTEALTPVPVERPQQPLLKADVRATLAPRDIATAVETPAALVRESTRLSPAPIVDETTVVAPGTQQVIIRRRGTRLRARRIGIETPPLDQRLKETRTRKARAAQKIPRKPTRDCNGAELVLGHKSVRLQAPRFGGPKPANINPLASTKTVTKIIGIPRRKLRVRLAATV